MTGVMVENAAGSAVETLDGPVRDLAMVAETLARAVAYLDAGASGIFVPGVSAPEEISALTAGIDAPVNILVAPQTPSVAELGRLGVARVSLGSAVAEAAYGLVRRAALELAQAGTYASVSEAMSYGEINALMMGR